jgi:hypothetical protein
MLLQLLCKMLSSELHLYISLAYSLVSCYFWFTIGKSNWVHSHTQGLFPLVADDIFHNGCCKYCLLRGMMTRPLGMVSVSVSHLECFCGIWLWTGYVSKLLVLWFWNYVASATLNLLCNNLFELRCIWDAASYLWNVVTIDVLCWIMYNLGLYVGWFKILHDFMDYRDYMCSSAKIWSLWWLFLFLCSYNLYSFVTSSVGYLVYYHSYLCSLVLLTFVTCCQLWDLDLTNDETKGVQEVVVPCRLCFFHL